MHRSNAVVAALQLGWTTTEVHATALAPTSGDGRTKLMLVPSVVAVAPSVVFVPSVFVSRLMIAPAAEVLMTRSVAAAALVAGARGGAAAPVAAARRGAAALVAAARGGAAALVAAARGGAAALVAAARGGAAALVAAARGGAAALVAAARRAIIVVVHPSRRGGCRGPTTEVHATALAPTSGDGASSGLPPTKKGQAALFDHLLEEVAALVHSHAESQQPSGTAE